MDVLWWILLFCTLGGVLSVLAAAGFLLLPEAMRLRLLPHTVSFAIGALLGAAFLGLLPHALETVGSEKIHQLSFAVLLGLLLFFVLERLVLWRHCHHDHCEVHGEEGTAHHHHPTARPQQHVGAMLLLGNGVHNFIDGVLIGGAFLTDTHLGVVMALAVAAHEIPQEIGDFAVLLHSGFSRRRAFLYNILASLTTLVGGLAAYYGLGGMAQVLPYVLAVGASSLIYIAVADLIPGLHRHAALSENIKQFVLIGLGVAVIYLSHSTLH